MTVACCMLAGALAFVSGGSSATARAVEGIKASSVRGVPQVPQRPIVRPDHVWVPDRWVSRPGALPVHIPGRWERRLSERELYAPLAVIGRSIDRTAHTIPTGIRVEERVTLP